MEKEMLGGNWMIENRRKEFGGKDDWEGLVLSHPVSPYIPRSCSISFSFLLIFFLPVPSPLITSQGEGKLDDINQEEETKESYPDHNIWPVEEPRTKPTPWLDRRQNIVASCRSFDSYSNLLMYIQIQSTALCFKVKKYLVFYKVGFIHTCLFFQRPVGQWNFFLSLRIDTCLAVCSDRSYLGQALLILTFRINDDII